MDRLVEKPKEMNTRRPRRFRFSLRTLFVVVTVGCVWLGWQVSIVAKRGATRLSIENHGGLIYIIDFSRPRVGSSPIGYYPIAGRDKNPWGVERFPEVRRWLGDEPVFWIGISHSEATPEYIEEVANLFPEAGVGTN